MQVRSDLAWTTLTAGYTAGGGSLTVASSTTGSGPKAFPATGSFRVAITNPVANSPVKCLLEVTAVPDSTHFTTTSSDSLDANCSNGDWVFEVETASSMQSLLAEYQQIGTYASLPGSAKAGWRYKCTDSPHEFIYSGGVWNGFISGFNITDPTLTTWAWSPSQGSASVSTTNGFITLAGTSAGTPDIRARVTTVPGTPYTRTAMFFPAMYAANNSAFGMCVTDGTKFEMIRVAYVSGPAYILTSYYSNSTTFGSSVGTAQTYLVNNSGPVMFRISDTGTTRSYLYSADLGNTWLTIASIGSTSNLTPTNIGFYADPGSSSQITKVALASWG